MKNKKGLADYIGSRIDLSTLEGSRPVFQYVAEKGQASLSEMSNVLGLSRGTCNLHLQRLEYEQLVRRCKNVSRGAGRPTVIWGVDATANLTISLVFDVPFLHASLADFAMTPVCRKMYDLSAISTARDFLALLKEFLSEAKRHAAEQDARIRQIAVYVPGLLDPILGQVSKAIHFPLLNGFDFKALTSKESEAPCAVIPLGMAFYYGESELLPPDSNNMIIYWDLGVGVIFGHGDQPCALGCDPRDGSPTLAELGHIRIQKGGRRCHCGRTGCLEAYVGGRALIEAMKRKSITGLNDFIQAVMGGDAAALRIARQAVETLGRELAWPIQVMQTKRALMCGPLAPVFALFIEDFRRGLGTIFDSREIAELAPHVSPCQEERFLRGAHRLAARLFSRPGHYAPLLRTPSTLPILHNNNNGAHN